MSQTPVNGWIYVVTDGEAVKIGLTTTSVEKRNKQHQTGNPRPIQTLYKFWVEDVRATEAALHTKFADKRISGEWFTLTDADVYEIMKLYPDGVEGQAYMTFTEALSIWWDAVKFLIFRKD